MESVIQEIDRLIRAYERASGRVARRLYISHGRLSQLINDAPLDAFRDDAFGALYFKGLKVVAVLPDEYLDVD